MPRLEELPIAAGLTRPSPGWTLVQDRHFVDPSKAPLNPSTNARGKRSTRYDHNAASSDAVSSRRERATQRRLEMLDSENSIWRRDVAIALPKPDGGRGKKATTPAVRRILQSERSFKHHLQQEEALLKQQAEQGKSAVSLDVGAVGASAAQPANPAQRRKGAVVDAAAAAAAAAGDSPSAVFAAPKPDPAFTIEVPALPSREEMLRLVTAPALSYGAARVGPPPANAAPARRFCSLCGYWGTVRCRNCGDVMCGLEHKADHDLGCNAY